MALLEGPCFRVNLAYTMYLNIFNYACTQNNNHHHHYYSHAFGNIFFKYLHFKSDLLFTNMLFFFTTVLHYEKVFIFIDIMENVTKFDTCDIHRHNGTISKF